MTKKPSDERLERAIEQGISWLLAQQAPEGYWRGELEADTTVESDYVLYLHILGLPDRVPKLATYIRRQQRADGGWNKTISLPPASGKQDPIKIWTERTESAAHQQDRLHIRS